MESEENRVTILRNERDTNPDYCNDLEIELSLWQKIIIFFLNIMTGGFGTMLEPFLNKKKKKCRLIIIGILLGLLQIFHILHFFSLLKKLIL